MMHLGYITLTTVLLNSNVVNAADTLIKPHLPSAPPTEDVKEVVKEDGKEDVKEEVESEHSSSGQQATPEELREFLLTRMDPNKDGKITREELKNGILENRRSVNQAAAAADMRANFDTNNDGFLSLAELFQVWHGSQTAEDDATKHEMDITRRRFEAADLDKDNLLSESEVVALIDPSINDELIKVEIEIRDQNGDGLLSYAESLYTGGEPESEDPEVKKGLKEEFDMHDLDGDGQINMEEVKRWISGEMYTKKEVDSLFDACGLKDDEPLTAEVIESNYTTIFNHIAFDGLSMEL